MTQENTQPITAYLADTREFIYEQDKSFLPRFDRLTREQQRAAAEGIAKLRRQCARLDVPFEIDGLREIILDAKNNLFVWQENERARRAADYSVSAIAGGHYGNGF
jgi:hypothetical protein